jgi:hypothetical protein
VENSKRNQGARLVDFTVIIVEPIRMAFGVSRFPSGAQVVLLVFGPGEEPEDACDPNQ